MQTRRAENDEWRIKIQMIAAENGKWRMNK